MVRRTLETAIPVGIKPIVENFASVQGELGTDSTTLAHLENAASTFNEMRTTSESEIRSRIANLLYLCSHNVPAPENTLFPIAPNLDNESHGKNQNELSILFGKQDRAFMVLAAMCAGGSIPIKLLARMLQKHAILNGSVRPLEEICGALETLTTMRGQYLSLELTPKPLLVIHAEKLRPLLRSEAGFALGTLSLSGSLEEEETEDAPAFAPNGASAGMEDTEDAEESEDAPAFALGASADREEAEDAAIRFRNPTARSTPIREYTGPSLTTAYVVEPEALEKVESSTPSGTFVSRPPDRNPYDPAPPPSNTNLAISYNAKELAALGRDDIVRSFEDNKDSPTTIEPMVVHQYRKLKSSAKKSAAPRVPKTVFDAIRENGDADEFEPEDCSEDDVEPTDAPPGSDEKLDVLKMRLLLGQPLWNRREDRNDFDKVGRGSFHPVPSFAKGADGEEGYVAENEEVEVAEIEEGVIVDWEEF